jgi:serine/threonine-protein kinase
VKIADFGIALASAGPALTMPGFAMGSPPYMSPEQMQGERVDARSDLFALGVMLYELLTGQTPYPEPREDDEESLTQRMLKERYRRVRRMAPQTQVWLARLVRSCLRGRAAKRIGSASELRRNLERNLGSPSPADLRAELAAWLRDNHVGEAVDGETVVRAPSPESPRVSVSSWLLAAIACAITVASLLLIEVRTAPPAPVHTVDPP